jgi:hypothetical protein
MTKRVKFPITVLHGDEPDPVDTSKPGFWDDLLGIQSGLGLIDYSQFKDIVRATINCGDDYAAAAWAQFYGNRLNYAMSRHPEEQGYAMINLAAKLAKND